MKKNWEGKTVLIAEDEEVNYYLLEETFYGTNAKILWAKNGKEAIDMALANDIDLILMDIKMPGINGRDAIIEIKNQKPNIPIIAQTAFVMKNEVKAIKETGCDDYISKPINLELFRSKVDKFLSPKV
ncbi:MAG: response regulator [Bacteroidales bacterium]|nr:response regulator [Bacteroidales bacterium]